MTALAPHVIDRAGWGPGPWDAEPEDRLDFKAHGLPCLALRNDMGVWCGYVAVPPGHPAHFAAADSEELDVSVHGGLTYSGLCVGHICHVPEPGDPDDVWWLGFDTSHYRDVKPAMSTRRYRDLLPPDGFEVYRSLAYVRAECESLAGQLAAMGGA